MTPPPGRIVWLAVIAGYIVHLFVSLIGLAIGNAIDPQLTRGLSFATTAGVITTLLTSLSTLMGGWVAGRIAKRDYVKHGLTVGAISLVISVLYSFLIQPATLFMIVHVFVLVALGGLGGLLSRWFVSSQRNP